MARLVLGTNINNTGTSSIVRDVSPEMYQEYTIDLNGVLKKSSSQKKIIDFTNVKRLDEHSMAYAYKDNLNVTDVSSLKNIESWDKEYCAYHMFENCTNIIGKVDLSGVSNFYIAQKIAMGMFKGCTGITEVDLSNCIWVNGPYDCCSMFEGCTSLEKVDISSLMSLNNSDACYQMFYNCPKLKKVTFNSLNAVSSEALRACFGGCQNLDVYFPAIRVSSFKYNKNAIFQFFWSGENGTIHFPKGLEESVSSLQGYPDFSGTNTTILFDLPSTNILNGSDSKKYERNPKYDTEGALSWRINGQYPNYTPPCYTSTLNDPQVGDTIYSDPECTTAITIIDSIA